MDYNEDIVVAGKKLRKGYTTGSCAAAAAKAAVQMLTTGETVLQVSIDTPAGVRLTLPVTDIHNEESMVRCAVLKDARGDPDVTHGIKIFAEACYSNRAGVSIQAGKESVWLHYLD